MTLRSILLVGLLALLSAGCGGGGGGDVIAPPLSDETEPNDFTAQSVGELTATDLVLDGSTAGASDVDLFLVTLTTVVSASAAPAAGSKLLAQLDWSGSTDLELAISNADGIFIRHVDTTSHPESCTLAGLPPGDYTVRVGSHTSATTFYTLRLGLR